MSREVVVVNKRLFPHPASFFHVFSFAPVLVFTFVVFWGPVWRPVMLLHSFFLLECGFESYLATKILFTGSDAVLLQGLLPTGHWILFDSRLGYLRHATTP